ncbi:hypothetical protein ACTFIZ_003273 [Dictyostelium cf. discoideum]
MDNNLISELSKKKRGKGETIDLNSINSLFTKKKRISKKLKKDGEDENKIIDKETSKESDVEVKKKKEDKDYDKKKELENEKEDEDPMDFSKPIKWDQVKIDKLEYKNLEEIKFIATSIGIFKNGIRKHDLIEKIKIFIRINNEIVENKIKKDNINPFNRNTFDSLVIPISGKDGENELLFWKVFKNKSVFKTIMSHTQTISISKIQYDHIVSVESMINNNQINILKDKVKSNKYLSFFSNVDYIALGRMHQKRIGWYQLFLKIQDDKEFYKNLFKNYKDQIPFLDDNNKFGIIVDQLITANCIVGLQVLIENSLYTPTIQNLKDSISGYGIKLIKLMLPHISNEEIEKNIDDLVYAISHYSNSYNIYYFENDSTRDDEYYETIKFLINLLKSNTKHSNTAILHLIVIVFDLFKSEKKENLKTLIELITLFDSLDYWETFKKLAINFKYPWHEEESFNSNEVESLINEFKNKIESIKSKFSNDQLESSVYHPINYQSKENDTISKLLSIYHIVNKPRSYWLLEFFICYRGEFKVKQGFDLCQILDSLPDSRTNLFAFKKIIVEHANYRIWSTCFYVNSPNKSKIDEYTFDHFSHENFILFKKCPNRESQIELIDNLINDILTSSKDKLVPIFLLMLLVKNDNLELIDYFFSKVNKNLIVASRNDPNQLLSEHSIFKNIKSIEMFEYLFNKLDHFSFSINMADPKYCKHLETMATNKKLDFQKISFSNAKLSVSFIKYVLENPSNYYLENILKFRPIDIYENYNEYFQCLIDQTKIVKRFPDWPRINEHFRNYNFTLIPPKTFRIAFKIYRDLSPTDYFFNTYNSHLQNYYFDNMENDKLFKDDEIKLEKFQEYIHVIEFSTVRADLKTLDRVLAICEKLYLKGSNGNLSTIKSIILNNILKVTVSQQQIFTLEHLLSNHIYIFKKKTDSKSNSNSNDNFRNGIFTHCELRELVFISLSHYNIKFTNLLLSTISITKTQFETHSSKTIYFHFKDRFK